MESSFSRSSCLLFTLEVCFLGELVSFSLRKVVALPYNNSILPFSLAKSFSCALPCLRFGLASLEFLLRQRAYSQAIGLLGATIPDVRLFRRTRYRKN